MSVPDFKAEPRVRDKTLLNILHRDWRECVLCGQHRGKLSLHHISKHPRDDVRANLVMLCGSGTTGCHGLIEAGDRKTRMRLGVYFLTAREDVLPYLATRKGSEEAARAWVTRTYYV